MRVPTNASAVLCLTAAAALAGCEGVPTDPAGGALSPEVAVAREAPLKPGGNVSLDRVGPIPDVWVEPSEELRELVATQAIDMKDSDFMSTVLNGLNLFVDPCWDVSDLTVRVAVMVDGEVVSTADSEGGIEVFQEDFPGLDPGDGSTAGPGAGSPSAGSPECTGNRAPVRLSSNPESVPSLRWPEPDDWWPEPDSWWPEPDEWWPEPDNWLPAGELIPGPDAWSAWPKQWSFLKAKKAFLKAKKAFVPAVVTFDEAHDWFGGNDRPILAGGGFGTRAADGTPQLGGPIVVVGVMPGDNVSVMPGDNVSVMPGDRVAPKVGVTFFAAGPGDD